MYSHLSASVTCTMPFTLAVAKYADMIYVYGFSDGNLVQAVAEYQQRFPNRRIPTRRVFTRVYQTLRDTGTLPGVHIQPSVMLMKASMKKKHCSDGTEQFACEYAKNFKTSLCSPHEIVENTAGRGHISITRAANATSRTGRFC